MSRVYPGAHCRLIGSANGPKGPSVGRKCIAVHLYPHEHSLHGPIWRVRSADGMEFVSEHGGVGMEVDAAEDWLEVIPPEPPKAEPRIESKDLEKVE
jgi:hypothetical protein